MKLQLPVIRGQLREIIGFSNGVYDLSTKVFKPHQPEHWLMNHNGIEFTQPIKGENLQAHTPNFYRGLSHAASNDVNKMACINTTLFMILANHYRVFISR